MLTPESAGAMLNACAVLLLAALVVTGRLVLRARRTVGRVIAQARPRQGLRRAGLVGVQGAALAFVVWAGSLPLGPVATCVGVAIVLAYVTPGLKDAVCGEDGVQRGYYARTFDELEEWRLAGEHLRFRLFGEWTSVPLPSADQPRIRAKLLASCPERESRFKD
ncbi:MAG: hypothetical protein ACKVWV_06780 [Planctomycetota bacterium]